MTGFQARQLPHCRKGVQCERVKAPKLNLLSAGPQPPVVVVDNTDSSDDDKTVPDLDGSPSASDSYQPSSRQSSDSSFEISTDEEDEGDNTLEAKKYLVFRQNLLQLFKTYPKCAGPSRKKLTRPHGGIMIQVFQTCKIRSCGFTRKWLSQPMVGNVPAGNFLISAAMLMSGVYIQKFINALTSIISCDHSKTAKPSSRRPPKSLATLGLKHNEQ